MADRSHVTVVDPVPGGWVWRCSCGAASPVTFPRRERAVTSADWHRARAKMRAE